MATNKTDLWVYAHWKGMKVPKQLFGFHRQL
jgi:hypothetical protein